MKYAKTNIDATNAFSKACAGEHRWHHRRYLMKAVRGKRRRGKENNRRSFRGGAHTPRPPPRASEGIRGFPPRREEQAARRTPRPGRGAGGGGGGLGSRAGVLDPVSTPRPLPAPSNAPARPAPPRPRPRCGWRRSGPGSEVGGPGWGRGWVRVRGRGQGRGPESKRGSSGEPGWGGGEGGGRGQAAGHGHSPHHAVGALADVGEVGVARPHVEHLPADHLGARARRRRRHVGCRAAAAAAALGSMLRGRCSAHAAPTGRPRPSRCSRRRWPGRISEGPARER